jgi:D-alanyl-lipoteichoic acid acyltransferase DltB (MBOAT superfamily)
MLGRDATILLMAAPAFARWSDVAGTGSALGYLGFVAGQLTLAVGLYCAHSGLASFQIGWMRLFGHELPERYRYPLLATSPQDFWHRWNTWVGEWARRYLFVPVSHAAIRRFGGALGVNAGAIVAFAGVGLLHDLGVWVVRAAFGAYRVSLRLTLMFVVFGVVLVAWRALANAWAKRAPWADGRTARAVGWLVVVHGIAWLSWIALSVLRTGAFPGVIERALAAR